MAGPIEFTDEVLGAGVNKARMSLVSRLLCSSHPSRIRVQHTANNIWAKRVMVTVLDAGYGLFQFVFGNEDDYQDALNKSPWFIQSKIFALKKWEKPTHQLFLDLALVPYNVQLWDIRKSIERWHWEDCWLQDLDQWKMRQCTHYGTTRAECSSPKSLLTYLLHWNIDWKHEKGS
ncbi:unnamed protein product [Linum trigynum]|uniref:DUF4283 domain-containing protein n=1 Tax=Linum trigynum TaxID=586398 RepID=A0AAV2ERS1_9ROSI